MAAGTHIGDHIRFEYIGHGLDSILIPIFSLITEAKFSRPSQSNYVNLHTDNIGIDTKRR